MLRELSIKNFAIIDDLSVSFTNGLTVLTGETGAGKSIIIDAIHLLAGGRGSQEFIRHGAKKAELEGMFVIDRPEHPVFTKMADVGIDNEEGTIILRRDMNESGKSVCRVNGKLVTIAILREIGAALIDIHGQHETQELMDEKQHIHLLDQFAGKSLKRAKESYVSVYQSYKKLKRDMASMKESEQQIAQKIDLYQFQTKDIDDAMLQVGEEEELLEEKKRLQNYNRIYESLANAYESLNGDSKGLDYIGSAMSDLEAAATVDEQIVAHSESVSNAFYTLQDTVFSLKDTMDSMEFDPDRLNEVEQRLAQLQSMKRKYGASVEDILIYREKIGEELEKLINRDERLQIDQQKIRQLEQDLEVEAEELTILRKKASTQLSKAIHQQLQELYMEKATFEVHFEQRPVETYDQTGADEISFYISTNVGEPLKPLVKIASGGELSRMMLALKSIFSKHAGVTSIIFDEVDTGVSGRVAQAIAEKISSIARHSQVLCISHLPQVAAIADQHYVIQKEIEGNRTVTSVNLVTGETRVEELSRMMSGAEITTATLQHASELLALANQRKSME